MSGLLAIGAVVVVLLLLYLALWVGEWVVFAACSLRERRTVRINRRSEDG